MAGSWEISQGKEVLVGILHVDVTTVAWAKALREMHIPGQIMCVAGMPYDHARNTICQATLQHGFRNCFMLDSDVMTPPDAIPRLLAHRQPIVSGVYFRRSPPHGLPVAMRCVRNAKGEFEGFQWVTDLPPGGLIEVDVVGSGCLLLRRDLLEVFARKPQRPGKTWFDWKVDMQTFLPKEECLSEDYTMCMHAKKLGFKTMLDTSIRCRHVGYGEAGYGTFLPLDTNMAA